MDMNEFEHSEESATDSDEAVRASSPPEDAALPEEIRRLRLQLERLEAFQQTPQSHEADSADQTVTQDTPDQPNPAEPNQARRRNPIRTALLAIVAIVLCVGGFRFWQYLESYQDTDDAEVDGYLDPISTRINGTVSAVYVDNNQSAKAGQLLLQLDPRDYQVAVEQARAQLAQAQADLNSARQQYVSSVATIRQADAQNYLAQRNAVRYSQLIKLNVVSQSEFDQYDATARAQAATVKVDEAAAASAQRTIASKEAQLQASQAALDQAQLNLSYTRISAPADGIIGNRSAQLGQRVQPGQSLMALTQHEFWVTANFKETQLRHMRPGQPVLIHVDALGRDYQGHVEKYAGCDRIAL